MQGTNGTICSREIFTKKCRQQQNFDSDSKEAPPKPRDIYSDCQNFYPILKIDLYVIHTIC